MSRSNNRFELGAIAGALMLLCVPVGAEAVGSDLRLRAERGDAEAQFELSNHEEVPLAEGMRWVRLSADQGYIPAQMSVGNVFFYGQGAIQADHVEAFKWYKRAADQGSARGQNAIGDMYFEGYGVERDYAESVRWYSVAAEQGEPRAQASLGYAYQEGLGVPRDDREAAKWYREAIKRDHPEARLYLVLQFLRGRAKPEPGESVSELFEKMEQGSDPKALALIATVVSLAGRSGMSRDVETAMRVADEAHLNNEDIAYWFDDLYLRDVPDAADWRRNLRDALGRGQDSVDAFLKRFDGAMSVTERNFR